jgi:hypothetical protein
MDNPVTAIRKRFSKFDIQTEMEELLQLSASQFLSSGV